MEGINIREVRREDLPVVSSLMREVFDENIAPLYEKVGINTFNVFTNPKDLEKRLSFDLWGLLAENEEGVLGTIFVKDPDNISLFFVRTDHHGKGIGKALLEKAIEILNDRGIRVVRVNSSPNAVHIYKRLGFSVKDGERTLEGVRFRKMEKVIRGSDLP